MIEFDIKGKVYPAKELTELSIKEYNTVMSLINDDTEELIKIHSILEILTEIPVEVISSIAFESLLQIDWVLLLKVDTTTQPLKPMYMGRVTQPYDKMTFGKWIELDYFMKDYTEATLPTVVALLLLKGKYEMDDVNKLAKEIETNMNIIDGLTLFETLINWKSDLIKKYDGLFQQPEEDDDDEEDDDEVFEDDITDDEEDETDTGWLDVAYSLTNDDILKVDRVMEINIIATLNYLSFQKEKRDKEKEMLDKHKPA